jgi:hypothetical protein
MENSALQFGTERASEGSDKELYNGTYEYALVTLPRTITPYRCKWLKRYGVIIWTFIPITHGVTISYERYTTAFPVCYGSQKHHECEEGGRSRRWWRVTLYVHTCSGRNRIITLIGRTNTDTASNLSVTLPRNQLLICYVVISPVHTVTIRCYGTQ